MKLSWGFILSSLYCSATASRTGHVFVYDPVARSAPAQPPTVSPEAARLILAQRLGLSRYHSIKHSDDEIIQQLNTYGGRPQRLFGDQHEDSALVNNAHILLWIEDVADVAGIIKDESAYSAHFTISEPPSATDNDRLIQDIILQAESLPKRSDPKGFSWSTCILTEASFHFLRNTETHKEYLTILRADKADKTSMPELKDNLVQLLSRASPSAQDLGYSITVVLMPPPSSHSKRSAQPYGTYDIPSPAEARREKTEAFLSPSAQPSAESQSETISDLEDFPIIQQVDDSPVLGILPSCFSSESACEDRTHGCSGHGNCTQVRKGSNDTDKPVDSCWSCRCVASVVHVGGEQGMESKKKTTYWGGPACQKKDVSVPFFLFVGVGVLLAFLISSGIGLMYSMGSEELPGVIGAGVSGPTRK